MTLFNLRWQIWAVIVLAIAAAYWLGSSRTGAPQGEHATTEQTATVWTCSMHPQIQLPAPGQCPICGMDLIPLQQDGGDARGPRTLELSEGARTLAEIETSPVERHALSREIRVVGKLAEDESRVREISAWVGGRIDELYIDETGETVKAGQPLFDIYSPQLYSAQQELLQTIQSAKDAAQSTLPSSRNSAQRTVEAARERLRLWGLTTEQIAQVESRGEPRELVTIGAPISGTVLHKAAFEGRYVDVGAHIYTIADLSVLWLKLDVYESDLPWIQIGQQVSFTTETFAGETFKGVVSFLDPVLDERSRSVKVRVDVQNRDGRLKPGMFARANVQVAIHDDDGMEPLVIPRSAPLRTGKRAIVYVADPDHTGVYHGREVVLGPEGDGHVVVRSGLSEGERVVSQGAFKIDSALQIQARTSMMNPQSEPVSQNFRARLDQVLLPYLSLATALSEDDLAAARSQAEEVAASVRAIEGGESENWPALRTEIGRFADTIAQAGDLIVARAEFATLSERVIGAVRRYGASGEFPVLLLYCPMARNDQGAEWLQTEAEPANPYFGESMLRCGSVTETLVDAATAMPAGDHEHQ